MSDIFKHYQGSIKLHSLLLSGTNQLQDTIQHSVSAGEREKFSWSDCTEEAVKLCLVHQFSILLFLTFSDAALVPGGGRGPMSHVTTTGPAPIMEEYSEIIGFLSEQPPGSTWSCVIISSESRNVTMNIWRITVNYRDNKLQKIFDSLLYEILFPRSWRSISGFIRHFFFIN